MKDNPAVEDMDRLEPSIYKYILRHTRKDQTILVVVTLLSMPLVYLGLEIPKRIVNDALAGRGDSFQVFGLQFSQINYLLMLSVAFLLLVVINGLVKYYVNVYRGVLGERMLKHLRFTLYKRLLRFPLPHFHHVSSSEIIPVVTAETEPLGGFIGESVGLPVFQGGLLVTYIYFIFVQNVWLGIASIALYPIQMYLIPKLQKKVNELGRRRIQAVRKLAHQVGETADALADIRINNAGLTQSAEVDERLGGIFTIRSEIFRRKFFIKFLNNFIGQLTPFFFYSIGGYLVISGEMTLGALVAILAAYKDIGPPWKELLKFYQTLEDVRVKYAQVLQQFMPENILPLTTPPSEFDEVPTFGQSLRGRNLNLEEAHHTAGLRSINFDMNLNQHIGVRVHGKDAAKELALLLTGLDKPSSGVLEIDGAPISSYSEHVIGRNIGYSNANSFIFNVSVLNNLYLGLATTSEEQNAYGDTDELVTRTLDVLEAVQLDKEVLTLGLESELSQDLHSDLMEKVVAARTQVEAISNDSNSSNLVEAFDFDCFNSNLTVSENLLFGTPLNPDQSPEQVVTTREISTLLKQSGLAEEFTTIGAELADLMLELFQDVDEHSDLFQQYSFIAFNDLDDFRTLMLRYHEKQRVEISAEDNAKLIALALKLCPAQHRLGLVTETLQQKIVDVRKQLRDKIGINNDLVQFLDDSTYQLGMPVRANLLFGKLAHNKRHLREQLDEQLIQVMEDSGIVKAMQMVGLEFQCGNAGAHISPTFRSKLGLARALMKDPDIMIVDDALNGLDHGSQSAIFDAVVVDRKNKNLIWTFDQEIDETKFDCVYDLGKQGLVQIKP